MKYEPLPDVLRDIAAKLLERASEEFSNHGCNDYALPNDELHYAVLRALYKDDGQEEDCPPFDPAAECLWVADWWLMSFIAKKMKSPLPHDEFRYKALRAGLQHAQDLARESVDDPKSRDAYEQLALWLTELLWLRALVSREQKTDTDLRR